MVDARHYDCGLPGLRGWRWLGVRPGVACEPCPIDRSTGVGPDYPQSAQESQSQPLVITGMPELNAAHEQAKTQQQILGDMQRTFKRIGTVSFDQQTKTYRIMPTSNQEVQAINYVLQNPGMAQKVGYNKLTGGIKQTAKNLQPTLGPGYTYQLLKPGDANTVIYSVRDGKVLVDVVNGIK